MALKFTEVLRDSLDESAFRCYEVTCDGTNVSIDASDLDMHHIDTAMIAGAADKHGTFTSTGASIGDGVGTTLLAITVAGAVLGDAVEVGTIEDPNEITMTAYVQAAGVCEVRLQNESNGSKTSPTTYNLKIRKSFGLVTYGGTAIVFSPAGNDGDKFALWAFGN